MHGEIDALLAKGRIGHDRANRLKALVDRVRPPRSGFADADFVIEAVFEEMSVKQQVFAELEAIVSADLRARHQHLVAVGDRDGGGFAHPERVVGFHFFNPVAVMPLLEIVHGEQTDDATLATAFATGKALRKTTILVQGLAVVHRQPAARAGSRARSSRIVDEGTPIEVADSAFAGLTPMPPFVLLALVGPAIALHNSETLVGAFPDRFYASPNLRRVVAGGQAGHLRVGRATPSVDPEVAALLRARRTSPSCCQPEQVRDQRLRARRRGAPDARRGRRVGTRGPRPGA